MKIRLGIEKNVGKKNENTFGNRKRRKKTKKKRKKKENKMKKKRKEKRKKNEKNSRFFYDFGFLKNWLKIGHFGGLRLGTTKNEKKTKKK